MSADGLARRSLTAPAGRTRIRAASTAVLLALALIGCERQDEAAAESAAQLTLRIETPDSLTWGGLGSLVITLTNEGEEAVPGALVDVHLPQWLEFIRAQPAGTAVTVMTGEDELHLRFHLADSLPAGESRAITQHLRVHPPPPVPPTPDSIELVQLEPPNQVVRARLLTAAGEPIGAEVQATLNFVQTAPRAPPVPGDSMTRPRATPDSAASTRGTVEDTTRRPPRDSVPVRG